MAYFLFIDESGQDHKESPYEVLAGIAVHDEDLWNLIIALHQAENECFGTRYSKEFGKEIKARSFLDKKTFKNKSLNTDIDKYELKELANKCLREGSNANIKNIKALAIAKQNYVQKCLDLCLRYRCKAFASIIEPAALQNQTSDGLRKDYGYLFERFFHFLETKSPQEQGIIVFDELDKSKSHILINQTHEYFKETVTGRQRSRRIVPEPFFVHSDLTTGIQIADLIAYIISWGYRIPKKMKKPAREELKPFADQVHELKFYTRIEKDYKNTDMHGFCYIDDLRTKNEKNK